tara:strand:+ start:4012 stop:4473 length:462 start_codon:yes stop_codon:yes gene_type:complete
MAGFLTPDQVTKIKDLATTLHTTFARTITVYKNGRQTLVASNKTWNALYRKSANNNADVSYSALSETFAARIYYKDLSKEYLANEGQQGGTQNKIILPDGVVKIVVEETGYDYIREARRVEFDGRKFAIKSDGNPDGLVDNQFFTFTLTPIDE